MKRSLPLPFVCNFTKTNDQDQFKYKTGTVMRKLISILFISALLCMPFFVSAGQPVTAKPLLLRESQGTKEFIISGLYKFKTFDRMAGADDSASDSGIFARIPGVWFDFLGNCSGQFVDNSGKELAQFPGSDKKTWKKMKAYGLYELEFQTPAGSGQVLLNIAGCQYKADIYLNGTKLGTQGVYTNRFYPVGELLNKGGMNTLKIALQGFLEQRNMFGEDGFSSSTIHGGIVHDIKLITLENDIFLRFTGLRTDIKKGEAVFTVCAYNYKKDETAAELNLVLLKNKSEILNRTVSVKLPPGQSSHAITVPLKGLKLWEPETPELYTVTLKVLDRQGKVLYAAMPAETGFREVAYSGKDFMLNGHVATLFGDSAARINLLMYQCAGEYPELIVKNLRAMGFTMTNILEFQTQAATLQAADKYGLMLMPVYRPDAEFIFQKYAHFSGLTILEGKKIPAEEIEQFKQQFRDFTEYYALSPSVIGYARFFNWLCDCEKAYNPHLAGRCEKNSSEKADFADMILEESKKIDPSKINYYHHAGGRGPVYTHNRYWSSGVPLQEKCDFMKLWAEDKSSDKMPYMVTEGFMFPGYPGIYPKWGVSLKNPAWRGFSAPYMIRQIGTISNGTEAYFSDKLNVKSLYKDLEKDILRETSSYRYYGVMGHLLHTDSYAGYIPGKPYKVKNKVSDTIPGFVSSVSIWDTQYPALELTDIGRMLKHSFSGFTFFIMGAKDAPTQVEHNYFAGEKLRKTILVINETGLERDVKILVAIKIGDKEIFRKELNAELEPGARKLIPFSATLPDLTEKTHAAVCAEIAGSREPDVQNFDISIFPSYIKKIENPGSTAFYDESDSLDNMLRLYGIKGMNLKDLKSLDSVKLLVVGCDSLTINFSKLAKELKLADWIDNGGRIIVMEQNAPRFMNLNADPRRARNAFIVNAKHPVFAGLDDRDFADWTGKSSLLKEFPPAETGFHWSNPIVTSTAGIVSSLPLEKPHCGPFIPLLESGFDLQFSPLMEARAGKGLIIISQLDLKGHIGVDPAGTQFMGNLLKYVMTAAEPSALKWIYAGSAQGLEFLAKELCDTAVLGTEKDIASAGGIILGPESAKKLTAADIEKALKRGATVMCLPFEGTEKLLPVKVKIIDCKIESAYKNAVDAAGRKLPVSISDLFWQDKIAFKGWDIAGNNPLIDEIAWDSGRIIYCRVNPADFKGHYFQMKAYRLWSALLNYCAIPARSVAASFYSCRDDGFINLSNSAYFKIDAENKGLKEKWMAPVVSMQGWKKIVVPGAWEKTPFLENFGPVDPVPAAINYDGIAWYRFSVEIPERFRGFTAILHTGKIDDYDTTWFNGEKIGSMGKEFGGQVCTLQRVYRVPENVIKYGKENTIAIRVEDIQGDGGITAGPLKLEFISERKSESSYYIPDIGIMEVFGVTPYYNEQW